MQYFVLTAATANVRDITAMAEIGFGLNNLVLLQSNGMMYEDNEVTRGKHFFWKFLYGLEICYNWWMGKMLFDLFILDPAFWKFAIIDECEKYCLIYLF